MGKIAFLFSGQGAQYVGMGKELYENIQVSRKVFEEADKALGFSISGICFNGPAELINSTENTQPAVLTVSIAALKALQEKGINPDCCAGLSLGEYSALVCSNVFDFETAVSLVKKRGRYMQEAVPEGIGTMAAIIGLERDKVLEACNECSHIGVVEAANFNCPGQIVIAGEIKAVKEACVRAKEKGAMKTVMLTVSGPFHSSMLKSASIKLKRELENINLNDMKVPVFTNVNGKEIEHISNIKDNLIRQVMSSVYWEDIIKNMIDLGVDTFVEIGPGKSLSKFVKRINRKASICNVEDMQSLNKTLESLNNRSGE
ncbi:ACP S-malonyltransferase [Clostridium sp. JN-9]|uniref:ACP S-malonyltransferase n=1 Tax=Clostridium sp. JN-9 TaxID=2507159 RepID=UPI000FFE141D|nr:ACP S-malonyltransferase [Clostridium sp. JN-9]QAT41512.1 [acyl-carrier-protein] S-malonyltransferase [Clostridium sp. JN-9]